MAQPPYPSYDRRGRAIEDPRWDDPLPPEEDEDDPKERPTRSRAQRVLLFGLRLGAIAFALVLVWLAFTAPLNRSLQPIAAPSITVFAADGEVIARRGAHIEAPVDVTQLPPHVGQAFIAIEDRRFFRHLGIDPWGLARAMWRNIRGGDTLEGGSTITQQLAKTSFTGGDRTASRKVQEAFIALWLEAWLSKEDILSRYLSNVYFGDNVYGLRAAARHYFNVAPEQLTVEQAAMLAGVVNAPSRLAPTRNLQAAQRRANLVTRTMVQAGFLTETQRDDLRPVRLSLGPQDNTPNGTYFADWVLGQIDQGSEDDSYGEREVHTTLDLDMQRLAERVVRQAGLGGAQAALVAMRTDGSIVAMVGGRNYAQNAFNRATQARRQPGSTFKLFTYLAALRRGMTPQSPVEDTPLRLGNWEPQNYSRRYRGRISLADAFATSSNVAAVRLGQQVGIGEVIRAARDLGVSSPLTNDPTLPLGTSGVTLLEMTSAYAAVAADRYPVAPRGLAASDDLFSRMMASVPQGTRDPAFVPMRDLLAGVVRTGGTGTAAALAVPTFGKTGTTQDYRDALFIGFANDLVVGVWIGNDDNSPMPGVTGGSTPARIWRAFMTGALNTQAAPAETEPEPVDENLSNMLDLGNILSMPPPVPDIPTITPEEPDAPQPQQPTPAPRQDAAPPPPAPQEAKERAPSR